MSAKQDKRARKRANRQAGQEQRREALRLAWEPTVAAATVAAATANHPTHLQTDVRCVDCTGCCGDEAGT